MCVEVYVSVSHCLFPSLSFISHFPHSQMCLPFRCCILNGCFTVPYWYAWKIHNTVWSFGCKEKEWKSGILVNVCDARRVKIWVCRDVMPHSLLDVYHSSLSDSRRCLTLWCIMPGNPITWCSAENMEHQVQETAILWPSICTSHLSFSILHITPSILFWPQKV